MATDFLNQHHFQLHSECQFFHSRIWVTPTSPQRSFFRQQTETITEIPAGQIADYNCLCGVTIYSSSGNISKVGVERLWEPEDREDCSEGVSSRHDRDVAAWALNKLVACTRPHQPIFQQVLQIVDGCWGRGHQSLSRTSPQLLTTTMPHWPALHPCIYW